MDRKTALAIFEQLEEVKLTEFEGDPPAYDVRLTAGSVAEEDRTYGVRVTAARAASGLVTTDEWLYVFETAREHSTAVDVQNNGVELT